MGKYLTAADILQAEDFVFEDISIPEWGGTVRIRSLSGAQRATLKKAIDAGTETADEMICVMCMVDDDGNRIFNSSQIEALRKKNTKAITRIAKRALVISGMIDPAKAVEEAKKNSGETENADSSYD